MNNNAPMRRLGDYIRQVDVRNRDLEITNLVGLSIDKVYIPSVANTIGTDLSNYKIIRKNQFACSLMQVSRDKKMPIAVYKGEDAIMSPAYPIFEVIDDKLLLPDYLHLWFVRPEFDREVTFYAVGGVRGSLEWDDFCDLQIPVPPIEEQREIVARHKAIEHKIDVNRRLIAKLEETARTIYRHTFVENIDPENLPAGWRMGNLSDFGTVITGKTPSSSCPNDFGSDLNFVTPADFRGDKFISNAERGLSIVGASKLSSKMINRGDIMVTCIGSDMGKVAISSTKAISNQQINSIKVSSNFFSEYLYYLLSDMKQKLYNLGLGSSTLPLLNKSDFEKIAVIIPDIQTLENFSSSIRPISFEIENLSKQNNRLNCLSAL